MVTKLCECGCGERVGNNRFIRGHNSKGNKIWLGRKHKVESKIKISKALANKQKSKTHKMNISKSKKGKHSSPSTEFKKGHKVSEECKQKLRDVWKKRIEGGYTSHLLGKHHSKEHIKKFIESRKGYVHSEETKRKIGLGNKGKIKSEEVKRKISEARQRQIMTRGKDSPMYGKHHSEEAKKKMSLGHKGKKLSKETKNKMKEYWNSPKMKEFARQRRKKMIFPVKDTSIEVKIQNFLSLLHIEFFTHKYMNIEHGYQCDILIPKQETEGVIIPQKTIIECDGCFFHCCPICDKINKLKWTEERREMDKLRTKELQEKGFRVIRLWEHEIKVMEVNDLRNKVHGNNN